MCKKLGFFFVSGWLMLLSGCQAWEALTGSPENLERTGDAIKAGGEVFMAFDPKVGILIVLIGGIVGAVAKALKK